MFRVKPLAFALALAFCGAIDGAAARQLPIASQEEADALAEYADLRSCIWAEGQLLCTPYVDARADAGTGYDSGYYAPGIYVGVQNPRANPSPADVRLPRSD